MRIVRAILSLFVVKVLCHVVAIGGNSVPLIPIQGKSIVLVVNSQEKTYYVLTKSIPIKVKVTGPTKLQMLTRLCFPRYQSSTEKYSVKVTEGDQTVKVYSTAAERSDASFKDSELVPGKSRKFSIDVPDGDHTYQFLLDNTQLSEAALRFSVVSTKKSSSRRGVSLEPLSYDKVVTAVVKEKLITYYISSKEQDVQLRVIGPTRLKITARLNFDATMKGEQTYAISVSEAGKRILLKPLSTTKSLGISYREWKDVVPGKIDVLYLDVPSGEHTYRFNLEDTNAGSVALRFSIPSKDLDNEG